MPRRSPLRTVRATHRGIRLKQAARACGLAAIAFPRCLEDSLPQSLYLPLASRPVDPVPIDRCPGRSPAEDPLVRSPYRRLTCPSVPAALANHSSKAHLPMWARFRARAHRPGIRPVIRTDQRRADRPRSLSCRLSAAGIGFLGILYPPGTWAFVTSGLPPPRIGVADPDGVSMFRTHETRLGLGALSTPGTMVSTRPRSILGRHLPPSNGPAPIIPALNPVPGCMANEASARVHWHSPHAQPSPGLWTPDGAGSLGLSRELRTQSPLAAALTHVTAGTGLRH